MDDETKVVQELASKVPSEGPRDYSYPDVPKPESEAETQPENGAEPAVQEDPFNKYIVRQEVLQYFQIPPTHIHTVSESIDKLIDFAKQETNSTDLATIIKYLNDTERTLGIKHDGDRLAKLNQYRTIKSQIRLLQEKEKALYG